MNDLSQIILEEFSPCTRVLARDLEKTVSGQTGKDMRQVRQTVREMVGKGLLAYTYEFGSSFLEPGFSGPVRVGERIVLAPPASARIDENDLVRVTLEPGGAFGTGRHPTTRLCLCLLEEAVRKNAGQTILDVGTGSGVLAIAGVLLGAVSGLGLDTDPVAVFEARKNGNHNGLENRLRFSKKPMEKLSATFSILTANLRTPTLVRLVEDFYRRLVPGGLLVVSGMRNQECNGFLRAAANQGFSVLKQDENQGWTGLLLTKQGHKP